MLKGQAKRGISLSKFPFSISIEFGIKYNDFARTLNEEKTCEFNGGYFC